MSESPFRDTDFLDYFPLRGGVIPASSTKIQALPYYEDDRKNQIFQPDTMEEYTIKHKKYTIVKRIHPVYRTLREANPFSYELQEELTNLVTGKHVKWVLSRIPSSELCFFEVFDNIAEDGFLLTQREDGSNYISHVYLGCPNDWGAEQAIGKSFEEAHAHIPNIDKIMPDQSKFFKILLNARQPFERVGAINFRVSPDLNRHIDIPENIRCAPFDLTNPSLWCRFERQVAIPLKSINSVLLTVKTYQFDCNHPDPLKRDQIIAAIEEPNPKAHAYKFLMTHQEDILKWLKS